MLNTFKGKELDDRDGQGSLANVLVEVERLIADPQGARSKPTTQAIASCIGSGMTVIGTIECKGPASIFGRVDGEVRVSDHLLIGEGAQVDGTVIAQEVMVSGRVNGTIRAIRVKLEGGGAVDGDIFHQKLSIDEISLFEGISRRVENPMDVPSGIGAKDSPKTSMQFPDLIQVATTISERD